MNTIEYAQPEQYHFCQDSVLFPRWIALQLTELPIGGGFRALDLCAGCGVIGLDLCFLEPRLLNFDFVEVQEVFRPYWQKNCANFPGRAFNFYHKNYENLKGPEWTERYDLVVGNPPYFEKMEGKLSASELNNRCRFFIDGSFESLLAATSLTLKVGGQGFLLVKDGSEHGRQMLRSAQLFLGSISSGALVDIVADIRGTKVLRMIKT